MPTLPNFELAWLSSWHRCCWHAGFFHKKDDIPDQRQLVCVSTPFFENENENEDDDRSGGDNDKSVLMIWTKYHIMFYRWTGQNPKSCWYGPDKITRKLSQTKYNDKKRSGQNTNKSFGIFSVGIFTVGILSPHLTDWFSIVVTKSTNLTVGI